MAKLFEKQRTNFYHNWLSFIEDFEKLFGVFFMGHSVDYSALHSNLMTRVACDAINTDETYPL